MDEKIHQKSDYTNYIIKLFFLQVSIAKKVKCNKNVTLHVDFSDNLEIICVGNSNIFEFFVDCF